MSETATTFTAAQVRGLHDAYTHPDAPVSMSFASVTGVADALAAYATRLEQDEQDPAMRVSELMDPKTWLPFGAFGQFTERFGAMRWNQGRREVLKEIAAMAQPVFYNGYEDHSHGCAFCGDEQPFNQGDGEHPIQHKPDCLWLRAQQAVTP